MENKEDKMAKIKFETKSGKVETLWAYDLGNGHYRVDNTPWFQYGVSWQDIVEAKKESTDDFPLFVRIIEKSGNRTMRVIFKESATDKFFDEIKQLGCSFEGFSRKFIGINIPPEIDLQSIVNFLNSKNIQWEYADPTYEELNDKR